jgi:hypothetical protein
MKTTITFLAFLFTVATATRAQIAPAATAGKAELQYSARYSQNAEFLSGTLGNSQNATISGNVEYANGFKRRPFSLTFGGGYSWNLAGVSYGDGVFENLFVSQGIVGRKWNIQFSDNISYLNEAPITGFSGVPGTGEPIGGSNPTPPSNQTILTLNTRTVGNTVNAEYEHTLTYATSITVGGSSELLRYPDGNGLDTNAQMANAGLTRHLNARNSLSGQYSFTDFTYPANNLGVPISNFVTNAVFFGYQREWNRRVSTNISVGPEWLTSSDSAVLPSSTSIAGNASAIDQFRFGSASLTYSRQVGGGGGYLAGAEVDSISAGFAREFVRKLSVNLTGGYMRTSGLANQGTSELANQAEYDGKFGAAMATLRLSRYFTAFASYTGTDQSTPSSSPGNALSGLWQVVSFGVGYSPREKRVNSQ